MTEKLKNLLLRLLNAVIWVPVIVAGVVFWTWKNHLLARVLITIFSMVAGIEVGNLLRRKESTLHPTFFAILAGIIPVLTLLAQEYPRNISLYILYVVLVLLFVFTWEVFTYSNERSPGVLPRLGGYLFGIIYPGFFFAFMMMLPLLPYPITAFAMFFFVVMLNDTFAYFVGLLWGKCSNTRGIVLVSPKKSLVGFLGGITASIATVTCFYYWIQPQMFGSRDLWYVVVMGLVCGMTGIVGDLFESLLKRSVQVKDSGNFFMGRGGVLDSFDSLLFVSPVYFYFMVFM